MEKDIFIKHLTDVYNLSEKYGQPRFSDFLDGGEQTALLQADLGDGVLFGGYSDAERRILGVFPDWMELDYDAFPIKIIKFTKKYEKELTHRDFLGTILSLGIKRNKIGDILVDSPFSYTFVLDDIAEFIAGSVTKIANCGVKTEIVNFNDIQIPQRRFEVIDAVAASQRLDAVVGALLNISRSKANALIESGRVSINHIEILRTNNNVKLNDLLSVRGFGRAKLTEIGAETRSGRIHIKFNKYI